MILYINDIYRAVSNALDAVEFEFIGTKSHHAQRVALIAVEMLKTLARDNKEEAGDLDLMALAAAGNLHDNGLTTYYRMYPASSPNLEQIAERRYLKRHCEEGDANLSGLHLYELSNHAILYHHENADGSGPFGLTASETPLYARLIHLADSLDVYFALDEVDKAKYEEIVQKVHQCTGTIFDEECATAFLETFPLDRVGMLRSEELGDSFTVCVPQIKQECSFDELNAVADFVARITDYKSTFTSDHTQGVARRARDLAHYYDFSEQRCSEIYLAGAFHDIGKLYVPTMILEKPARLTESEFEQMKYHALATWEILGQIRGFENIQHWAGLHHEKLDGSGYPFGKTGDELDFVDRMLCCIDIYQALTEYRPYRTRNTHVEAIRMMRDMAHQNKIDASIVEDIDSCFGA